MNSEQIKFNKNFIKDAYRQIAELQREMDNPRSRPAKNEQRRATIASLRDAIGACLERLCAVGEISYR